MFVAASSHLMMSTRRYRGRPPSALTRLAQDGWGLVTSVSLQKMEGGRQLVQEIIHTMVRDVPDEPPGQL